MRTITFVAALLMLTFASAQLPNRKPTYQMNMSTMIMPCNDSGFTDPATTKSWAIVDFDWSNAKALWVKNRPMNDEEYLQMQLQMSAAASKDQSFWVYRGTMWAYPWYTSIRKTLENPAYHDWFIKFKPVGPWYSSKCDNNYNPPLCSDLYHNQEQTPGYPHGDGDCAAPNCDCGGVPCGFYIWNHSSTTVVNNQTFLQWFRDSYVFDYQGTSPLVSGMYFDDYWVKSGQQFPDSWPHMVRDMGLTPAEQDRIAASYEANMKIIYAEMLERGMMSWQQMWNGEDDPQAKTGCCTNPIIVKGSTCAPKLRKLCAANSSAQTRFMHYAFSPGGCGHDPSKLADPIADIANFLLIRGPFGYLGHGWLGCSQTYEVPEQLNWDYGEPLGLCHETAEGSGVFVRKWSKATIAMDCNTWSPTINMTKN